MNNRYPQYLIQLFAKAPIPGHVKTRMSPVLSVEQATQLHRALTVYACDNLCGNGWCNVELWAAPDPNNEFLQAAGKKYSMVLRQQVGESLGDKMLYAARAALQQRVGVILVGADCPFVDSDYVGQAITTLEQGIDVVLGPASDGGYVLLGLRRVAPLLFSAIEWGSETVLTDTLERVRQLQWSCSLLEELDDIDRPVDLHLLNDACFPENLRRFADFA